METQKTTQWIVPDMECEGCVRTIQRVLIDLPGVQEVSADLLTKRVSVRYDTQKITHQEIFESILSAGFSPQE